MRRLDPCLTVVDGRLRVEECDAHALAERHGTPLHVVSEDQLRRNVRRIAAAFEAAWPHGPVRAAAGDQGEPDARTAPRAGRGGRRLRRVRRAGARGRAARRHAARADLVQRADQGRRQPRARGDARRSRHRRLARRARAARCDRAPARASRRRAAAAAAARAGADDADRPGRARRSASPTPCWRTSRASPATGRCGGCAVRERRGPRSPRRAMHVPRHAADPRRVGRGRCVPRRADRRAVGAAGGWRPREIDVGGGFPSPRDPAGRALARRAGAPPPPPIEAFAAAVGSRWPRRCGRAGIAVDGVVLEVEPGRSLYGDAGVHLTRVLSRQAPVGAGSVHVGRDGHERGVPARRAARAQRLDRARRRADGRAGRAARRRRRAARAASTCWPPASSCPRWRPATCSRSSTPAPIRTPRRATSTRCRGRRPCS